MKDQQFSLINPIRRKASEWVSVREILNSKNLSELAMEVAAKLGDQGRFAEIHASALHFQFRLFVHEQAH